MSPARISSIWPPLVLGGTSPQTRATCAGADPSRRPPGRPGLRSLRASNLVETDALQLPASARSRGPLLASDGSRSSPPTHVTCGGAYERSRRSRSITRKPRAVTVPGCWCSYRTQMQPRAPGAGSLLAGKHGVDGDRVVHRRANPVPRQAEVRPVDLDL